MLTTALRLYGKHDLRLEKFELPEINDDEILASVITDSICLSTLKEVNQGADHKKVPNNIATNPIIIGHEFCGNIVKVGKNWQHKFKENSKYVIQANLQLPNLACPGYSFPYIGGEATYIVIPKEVMERDCLLSYEGDTYFEGSMIEPLSCVIGAFNANYHLIPDTYNHKMGIKEGGNTIIFGGLGPMGMLSIDYAMNGPIQPKKLVITGRNEAQIEYCKKYYPSSNGVEVIYVNVKEMNNTQQKAHLLSLVEDEGYDDIFIYVPDAEIINIASNMLATDGCLNLFAGPQDPNFHASINCYDIHYAFTHYVGTSGGNTEDMREGIRLIEQGKINVNKAITHVLGLDSAAETTINQTEIKGGKKLVYSQKSLPRFSIKQLIEDQPQDPFFAELKQILINTNGLWSKDAEDYILQHAKSI